MCRDLLTEARTLCFRIWAALLAARWALLWISVQRRLWEDFANLPKALLLPSTHRHGWHDDIPRRLDGHITRHWSSARPCRGSFLFFLPWEGYTLVGTTDVKTKPDLHHQVPEDGSGWKDVIHWGTNMNQPYRSRNPHPLDGAFQPWWRLIEPQTCSHIGYDGSRSNSQTLRYVGWDPVLDQRMREVLVAQSPRETPKLGKTRHRIVRNRIRKLYRL